MEEEIFIRVRASVYFVVALFPIDSPKPYCYGYSDEKFKKYECTEQQKPLIIEQLKNIYKETNSFNSGVTKIKISLSQGFECKSHSIFQGTRREISYDIIHVLCNQVDAPTETKIKIDNIEYILIMYLIDNDISEHYNEWDELEDYYASDSDY